MSSKYQSNGQHTKRQRRHGRFEQQQQPPPDYSVIPRDDEAETAVLGALLHSVDQIADVQHIVSDTDFFWPGNAWIYRVICCMAADGKVVDPYTVANDMAHEVPEDLLAIGGAPKILELYSSVITSAQVLYHAKRVAEASRRRRLHFAAAEIVRDLQSGWPAAEAAEKLAEAIKSLDPDTGDEWRLIDDAAFEADVVDHAYLVGGILAAKQPCVVGGFYKSLKTTICIELAVSLASGTPFLGRFEIPQPRRVVIFSGESGQSTLQEIVRRVRESKGLAVEHVASNLLWNTRVPSLGNPRHLAAVRRSIEKAKADVVIFDPLYQMLSANTEASNLFAVGGELAKISRLADDTGATPIVCHHTRTTLANPFGEPQLQDLAWAGIREWARQWLLLGRREAYDPASAGSHRLWLSVGGSAGHSGLWGVDVQEGSRGDAEGRTWATEVRHVGEIRAINAEAKERQKEAEHTATIRRRINRVVEVLRERPGLSKSQLADAMGMSRNTIASVITAALDLGEIETGKTVVGNRTVDGYYPIEEPQL